MNRLRARTALAKLAPDHSHHAYHHNISFRFPTVPPWYRGRGAAGVPPALYTFRFPQRTGMVGKGGRDARGPGSLIPACTRRVPENEFPRTPRRTARDGPKFAHPLTKTC